jgi:hypothetical protein
MPNEGNIINRIQSFVIRNSEFGILVLLSFSLYFFKLGSFSLYDAAETTYGEFTKNILQTGDWLTLHYNGQIIFDKPPLYYWLAAALSYLIGFNEWAMRFFAALSGVLTVITTYWLGKEFYNRRTALFSGLIVMTAFQFLVQSRIAELDVVLTLLMLLGIGLFYKGYRSGNRNYYLGMYFPLATGLLIKGILAVALPAFAIFLFLLFKKELGKIRELRPISGIIILAVIGLPWYIAEYLIHGQPFLDFALGFLFLARFQGVVAGHTGPWYYYFPALLLGFAPWSQFLPLSMWLALKNWKNEPELLMLCFIIPAMIVFSVAKTKIPNYILPLYPFLAIMMGNIWDQFLTSARKLFRGMALSNLFFLLIIIVIIFGFIYVGQQNYPVQYADLMPGLTLLAWVFSGGCLLSILFFFAQRYSLSFATLPILVFAVTWILTMVVLPQVEALKGEKPLGAAVARVISTRQEIGVFDIGNRPGVVLYNVRPVVFLSSPEELASFLQKRRGYVFTTTDKYEKMSLPGYVKVLDKKGDLMVIYSHE